MGIEDDSVRVADISMHLLEAIERGEATEGPGCPASSPRRSSRELYLSGSEPPEAEAAMSPEGDGGERRRRAQELKFSQ